MNKRKKKKKKRETERDEDQPATIRNQGPGKESKFLVVKLESQTRVWRKEESGERRENVPTNTDVNPGSVY